MTSKKEHFSLLKMSLSFVKNFQAIFLNIEYSKQVIRSSGSVGSNYIEANESLGKKDFVMKVKICRKEAKESAYWLRLLPSTNRHGFDLEAESLFDEAIELKKIFSSIVEKSK